MAKKFFIRNSNDLVIRELEKLQNKVNFLEASTNTNTGKKKITKKTAIYSTPVSLEAKKVTLEFEGEGDDEMFNAK